MFATIRRYEATDQSRTSELVKKANDSLLPRLTDLPSPSILHPWSSRCSSKIRMPWPTR